MNFAIIAAGEGSRLLQEGVTTPKPLLKINNTPMIHRIIKSAITNGATSLSIVINESSAELKKYLTSLKLNIQINLIVKTTPSSMHSLFELAKYLDNKPFFLATTDSIYKEDEFSNYVNFCKASIYNDAILAITKYVDDEKPLSVKLDAKNNIINFEDSIGDNQFVTGGLYYFSTNIFVEMEEALKNNINRLRNFLRMLLEKQYKINTFRFSKIIDVDHIKDIESAEKFLLSKK